MTVPNTGAPDNGADDRQSYTTIGSYGMAIARTLEAAGIDSSRIFRAIGIEGELSNDPMNRLPAATMTRLYRACVDVTNNPYFGLQVARHIHVSNLHALGYALAASTTLMDFCVRLERYMRLVSQVADVVLEEEGDEVRLRFKHLVAVSGETEDCFFAFLVMTMRQLYRPGFNPVRVDFRRALPLEGAGPYETLFRAPVSFSNTEGVLVFDREDLRKILPGSCPELAQVNDNISISYLAKLDKNDVVTGVIQKIIEFLPDGECGRDKVAAALCMSPTTLQARLAQRGSNFQQLLDDTRKDMACSYLRQGGRSVTEVTFLLGFADTSNFTRAFKRWTGVSPTEFRQQP
ncbi:AraC family transcriptional regulator [Duganella sp. S19_KUP01_CR8]|uniref:AraC family transcriptional regulator n=1 Tax=Duganella sp. S19_KUP01_CR8 TaxID=3025502 RepID=UPI002FCDB05A